MTQEEREAERQWALKMLALEEERGSIVPGGAVGGPGMRARQAPSVALRARARVRFLARAVPAPEKKDEQAA